MWAVTWLAFFAANGSIVLTTPAISGARTEYYDHRLLRREQSRARAPAQGTRPATQASPSATERRQVACAIGGQAEAVAGSWDEPSDLVSPREACVPRIASRRTGARRAASTALASPTNRVPPISGADRTSRAAAVSIVRRMHQCRTNCFEAPVSLAAFGLYHQAFAQQI
jgi:hypothetical protein